MSQKFNKPANIVVDCPAMYDAYSSCVLVMPSWRCALACSSHAPSLQCLPVLFYFITTPFTVQISGWTLPCRLDDTVIQWRRPRDLC